jgi:hypothetical protein
MAAKFGCTPGRRVPDAIVAMTPEAKVMYRFKGALAMFGHTSVEAAAVPLECLIAPEIRGKK